MSKKTIILHSLTYALICLAGVSVVVLFALQINKSKLKAVAKMSYTFELITVIVIVVSNLPLLWLLLTIIIQSKQQEVKNATVYDPDSYEPSDDEKSSHDSRRLSRDIQAQNSYVIVEDMHKSTSSVVSSSMSELERNILGTVFKQH